VLYEVMNLAQLWKLPIVYVCENNLYNEYTHCSETTAGEMMARPAAFGMAAESVDGQDVRAVYEAASSVVERARAGGGPAFLLCHTYRYRGHHVGDIARDYYRSADEERHWTSERDPIAILGRRLREEHVTDQAALDRVTAELTADMDGALEEALAAPYPAADKAGEDVYA
jgi:pyruvate dehydrogenase E1 component alpha subunit